MATTLGQAGRSTLGYLGSYTISQLNNSLQFVAMDGVVEPGLLGLPKIGTAVFPSEFSQMELFGVPTTTLFVSPEGLSGITTWGQLQCNQNIQSVSIYGSVAFGIATAIPGSAIITPEGLLPKTNTGTALLNMSMSLIGISAADEFGTDLLILTLSPSGISATNAFGTDLLSMSLNTSGKTPDSLFGSSIVSMMINPLGRASGSLLSSPMASMIINPRPNSANISINDLRRYTWNGLQGYTLGQLTSENIVVSTAAFGLPLIFMFVSPSGKSPESVIGQLTTANVIQTGSAYSINKFGNGLLSMIMAVPGIESSLIFGNLITSIYFSPAGIAMTDASGNTQVIPGPVTLTFRISNTNQFGDYLLEHGFRPLEIALSVSERPQSIWLTEHNSTLELAERPIVLEVIE